LVLADGLAGPCAVWNAIALHDYSITRTRNSMTFRVDRSRHRHDHAEVIEAGAAVGVRPADVHDLESGGRGWSGTPAHASSSGSLVIDSISYRPS